MVYTHGISRPQWLKAQAYQPLTNRQKRWTGCFNKGPCQIFIAVLCVGSAFLFAVTKPGAIDAAAIGGIVTDFFKAGYTPCFQHDGKSENQPNTIDAGQINDQFGKSRPLAINAYKDFVRAGIGLPAIWGNLAQQMYLGSDEFVAEMQEKLNAPLTGVDMQEVPRMQRRPPAKSLEWYEVQYEQRDSGMVSAYRSGDYTKKEIADWFGVHYATVSRALKKAENV